MPLLALVVGVLFWLVVGRAMRKVESVRVAVAGISESGWNERVANPHTGDELERLVATMNDMLERLQGSIERERQFVADASHELRSPIAAARAIPSPKYRYAPRSMTMHFKHSNVLRTSRNKCWCSIGSGGPTQLWRRGWWMWTSWC